MTALRTALEDSIVSAISSMKVGSTFPRTVAGELAAVGGYMRHVAPYGGELTPTREGDHFQRATQGVLPAALVTTDDSAYEGWTSGRKADLALNVVILIGASNLRSPESTRRGDGASMDPGIYQMIEDIREQLFRRELGVDGAGWAIPISESPVLRGLDRQIWSLTYTVDLDVAHAPEDSDAGEYVAIDNSINFPSTDPGAPLNPVLNFSTPDP